MKFSMGNLNLRVFVRAVHSLAKIGDEIYFEWIEEGLTVRSVNSSRSAYACFTFYPDFFAKCVGRDGKSDGSPMRWKISVKSCLTVFRSQSSFEKKVDRCKICLDTEEARLVIQFFCKQGVVKTYKLTIIDCESLQAVFKLKDSMSYIAISSKVLADAMQNFQPGQEEVTLCAGEDGVEFKNYVEEEAERGKTINTSLTLLPDEFEEFNIMKNVAITFCLKELKALLTFGESMNLLVKIYFEGSGRPLIFIYDGDSDVVSHFVLATLADCPGLSQPTSTQASSVNRRPAQTHQSSSCLGREDSLGDINMETIMNLAEEEPDEVISSHDHTSNHLPMNGFETPAEKRRREDGEEPSSKKRCTSLFASILEESWNQPESPSFSSQRPAVSEQVLVADSDPED